MRTLEEAKKKFQQLKCQFHQISKPIEKENIIHNQKQTNSAIKTSRCSRHQSIDSNDQTQRKHKKHLSLLESNAHKKIPSSLNSSIDDQWSNLREKQQTLREINQLLEKKCSLLRDIQGRISPAQSRIVENNLKTTRLRKNQIKAPNLEQIRNQFLKKGNKNKIKWK